MHFFFEFFWFEGDKRRCYNAGRTNDEQLKIELLSQWKLEAEFRKNNQISTTKVHQKRIFTTLHILRQKCVCWTARSIARMEVLFPSLQIFFSFSEGLSYVQIGQGIQNFGRGSDDLCLMLLILGIQQLPFVIWYKSPLLDQHSERLLIELIFRKPIQSKVPRRIQISWRGPIWEQCKCWKPFLGVYLQLSSLLSRLWSEGGTGQDGGTRPKFLQGKICHCFVNFLWFFPNFFAPNAPNAPNGGLSMSKQITCPLPSSDNSYFLKPVP